MTDAIGGEVVVQTRPTVDVTGAAEALAVGPDEVLVLTFTEEYDEDQIMAVRDHLLRIFAPNRFVVLAAADVKMSKVDVGSDVAAAGDSDGQRPYVRPQIETIPACPTCASVNAVRVDVIGGRAFGTCHRCNRQWTVYDGDAEDTALTEEIRRGEDHERNMQVDDDGTET